MSPDLPNMRAMDEEKDMKWCTLYLIYGVQCKSLRRQCYALGFLQLGLVSSFSTYITVLIMSKHVLGVSEAQSMSALVFPLLNILRDVDGSNL